MILVVVLISQLLPLSILAAKDTNEEPEKERVTAVDVDSTSKTEDVYVVGEVEGLRETAVKHFLNVLRSHNQEKP